MQTYKTLTRTTLDKTDDLPGVGIYILAYMGRVVYVGKATAGVSQRLQSHWYNRDKELLGDWMDKLIADWCNVRLDVLEAPDERPDAWIAQAEGALIRRFNPLFNINMQV